MSFHLPTFLFQIVNFLVLVVLLRRLLWRPLSKYVADRQTKIAEELAAIEHGRRANEEAKAATQLALDEARLAKTDAERVARAEIGRLRSGLLEDAKREARDERERIVEHGLAELNRSSVAFLQSLGPEVGRLVEKIVIELGVDLDGAASQRLAEHLDRLPDESFAEDVQIETATGRITATLETALGRVCGRGIQVTTNPELIAGARLRAGDQVLDGSVRAQIAAVLAEAGRAS